MELDNALYDLQLAVNESSNIFADYMLYAINRWIETDRASTHFIKSFKTANKPKLLSYCLEGRDLSDDCIIRQARRYLKDE